MAEPAHLWQLSIAEAAEKLASREISSVELTRSHLDRIGQVEGSIRAFVTTTDESALAEAERIDTRRREGQQLGPLAGIPLAIKDVLCTEGVRTTCSSRMLEHFVPPYDATAVVRLRAAGAVLLGKTNMDEFAMGSSTENSAFCPTAQSLGPRARARRQQRRLRGGGGGGRGDARARPRHRRLGPPARRALPAPSRSSPRYGRVSRFGLVAFASSLDQIGPFATLGARLPRCCFKPSPATIRWIHPLDAPVPDYAAQLAGDVGLRVGVPAEYFVEGVAPPACAAPSSEAIETLKSLGAEVERDARCPHTALRRRGLLHHRAGRGQREPRPLRRREIRAHRRGRTPTI